MQRVRGVGGVFFKAVDPERLSKWYRDILGLPIEPFGGAFFRWSQLDASKGAGTVFSPFKSDTEYFSPSEKPFMFNFVVEADVQGSLEAVTESLKTLGKPATLGPWSMTRSPKSRTESSAGSWTPKETASSCGNR